MSDTPAFDRLDWVAHQQAGLFYVFIGFVVVSFIAVVVSFIGRVIVAIDQTREGLARSANTGPSGANMPRLDFCPRCGTAVHSITAQFCTRCGDHLR
jgi:hypothetical protein